MNYIQKQAALQKLAQVRLAINYIMRNRGMKKQAGLFSSPDTQKRDVTIQYTPEEIEALKNVIDPNSKGSILPPAIFGTMTGLLGGAAGMASSKGNPLAGLAGLAIGGGLGALTGHGLDRLSRWESRSKLEKLLEEIDKKGKRKVSISPAEINTLKNQQNAAGIMFGPVGYLADSTTDPMYSHNEKLLQAFAEQYPDLK